MRRLGIQSYYARESTSYHHDCWRLQQFLQRSMTLHKYIAHHNVMERQIAADFRRLVPKKCGPRLSQLIVRNFPAVADFSL